MLINMLAMSFIGFVGEVLGVLDLMSTLAKRRWFLGVTVGIATSFEILIIKYVSQNPDNAYLAVAYILSSIIGAELGINIYEWSKNWNRKKKISNTMKQVWEKRKENINENTQNDTSSRTQDQSKTSDSEGGKPVYRKIEHTDSNNRTEYHI